jgi:tyrosine aminotransferase
MMNKPTASGRSEWRISMSNAAQRTTNPIRAIVDSMKIAPNAEKKVISLALGDPAVFGNFEPDPFIIQSLIRELELKSTHLLHGYPAAVGMETARSAVALYCSRPNAKLTMQDVILASGCSGALEICITAMANPGRIHLSPYEYRADLRQS